MAAGGAVPDSVGVAVGVTVGGVVPESVKAIVQTMIIIAWLPLVYNYPSIC